MDQSLVGVSGILSKLKVNTYFLFLDKMRKELDDPTKTFVIAVVLIYPTDISKFLAVKRPPHASTLPSVWGLPAVTLIGDEQPELATLRLGKEKLNTEIEYVGCLGYESMQRGRYELTLLDVVANLVGSEPEVHKANTRYLKYTEQQWTNELSILQEAAIKGSLCTKILLNSQSFNFLKKK